MSIKKLTVLFDLDDTLIADFSTKFMPAYINALGDWITNVPQEKVVPGIRNATRKMMVKQKAVGTLEECFNWYFYSKQGLLKDELSSVIDNFYETRFLELKKYLTPIPGITEMIAKIHQMGHDICIATNPLFPRVATFNRVLWAGFSEIEINNFDLITSYEDFHFSKPNPSYYAEVLGRNGWHDQPTVMIGDSLDMDVKPAEELGFPTYLVDVKESSNGRSPLSSGGNRDDIPEWIQKVSDSTAAVPSKKRPMHLAILNSTPAVLDGYFRSISQTENMNEKATSILESFIFSDKKAFEKISSGYSMSCKVTPFEEDEESAHYLSLVNPVLSSFFDSRQNLLEILKNIPSQEWENVKLISLITDLVENDREQIRTLMN